MNTDDFFSQSLSHQQQIHQFRTLKHVQSRSAHTHTRNGQVLMNFASNDYLGFSDHPDIKHAFHDGLNRWGLGAGGSRLVSGNLAPHDALEEQLAVFTGKPRALVFPSGFQSNLAVLSTLIQKGDIIFMDKLNHASLIDGCRYSGATLRIFPHKDYTYLENILKRTSPDFRKWIVTDSLFSMDGDFADVKRLAELKHTYNTYLVVDEAHSMGICGDQGRGYCHHLGMLPEVDVVLGTLSKAFGLQGGFVCANETFIDYLINFARPFLFSTGILPALAMAASVSLALVQQADQSRQKLYALQKQARDYLKVQSLNTGVTESHIIPVIIGHNETLLGIEAYMMSQGIMMPSIRYPTVKRGSERLRLSLTSTMEWKDVQCALSLLTDQCTQSKHY